MSKALAIGLFFALLAVGVAFGVARDLYSRERGQLKGVVVAVDAGGQDFKSPAIRAPKLKVRLDDGQTVDVVTSQTVGIQSGETLTITELVMPWGQVWYKLKAE